jgi:hypothetical protein
LTESQGGEQYPTKNRNKKGHTNWSHFAKELLYKTCYLRKSREKDRSDGKMRKKI